MEEFSGWSRCVAFQLPLILARIWGIVLHHAGCTDDVHSQGICRLLQGAPDGRAGCLHMWLLLCCPVHQPQELLTRLAMMLHAGTRRNGASGLARDGRPAAGLAWGSPNQKRSS